MFDLRSAYECQADLHLSAFICGSIF